MWNHYNQSDERCTWWSRCHFETGLICNALQWWLIHTDLNINNDPCQEIQGWSVIPMSLLSGNWWELPRIDGLIIPEGVLVGRGRGCGSGLILPDLHSATVCSRPFSIVIQIPLIQNDKCNRKVQHTLINPCNMQNSNHVDFMKMTK